MLVKQKLSPYLLVFLLSFLVLLTLHFPFLGNALVLDDQDVIFGAGGVGSISWDHLLLNLDGHYYRPVGFAVIKLLYQSFHYDPVGYRLVNMLFLSAIAAAFYPLLILLGISAEVTILALILYIIHPYQGNAIQYVTLSHVLIGVIFSLLCVFWFIVSTNEPKRRAYFWGSLLAFICALLSHETSLIVLVFILAYGFFYKKLTLSFIQRLGVLFLAFLTLILCRRADPAYSTIFNVPSGMITDHFGVWISSWTRLLGWYIQHLIWPDKILVLWSTTILENSSLLRGLAALFITLFSLLLLLRPAVRPVSKLLLFVLLFGLALSGWTCFLYKDIWPFIEPHWFYFSSIGFYIFASYFLLSFIKKARFFGYTLIAASVLSLSWMTVHNDQQFINEESYCRFWLSQNKGCFAPYTGLFRVLVDKGEYRLAVALIVEESIILNATDPWAYPRLAYSLLCLGDTRLSTMFLNRALNLGLIGADAYYYYALYYNKTGNREQAQIFADKFNSIIPKPPALLGRYVSID